MSGVKDSDYEQHRGVYQFYNASWTLPGPCPTSTSRETLWASSSSSWSAPSTPSTLRETQRRASTAVSPHSLLSAWADRPQAQVRDCPPPRRGRVGGRQLPRHRLHWVLPLEDVCVLKLPEQFENAFFPRSIIMWMKCCHRFDLYVTPIHTAYQQYHVFANHCLPSVRTSYKDDPLVGNRNILLNSRKPALT